MEKFKELIKEYKEDFKNFFPIKDNKSNEDIIKKIDLLLEKYNNIVEYSKKFTTLGINGLNIIFFVNLNNQKQSKKRIKINNNEKVHDLLTTALVILSRIKRGERRQKQIILKV